MDKDTEQAWIAWHEPVVPFLCNRSMITTDQIQVALKEIFGWEVPYDFLDKHVMPTICDLVKEDIPAIVESVKHPEKCTNNTFTYNYQRHLSELDKPSILIGTQHTLKNKEDAIELLDDSIAEINHPKYC
jgi:hypothetical protein